jgi:predicted SprT family Zn-dependent metalloprotease
MPKTRTPAKTPTLEAYSELQTAYDHYNQALFQGQLPTYLITLHRGRHGVLGYFSHNRFVRLSDGRTATDEIAMNPTHFAGRGITAILSTLAHEMVHLWQAHYGKPSRKAYHNKQWAQKLKAIGLHPSDTGEAGGKETGQKMAHYIIPSGAFERATAALMDSGFALSWADAAIFDAAAKLKKSGNRVKYTCPGCGANAWGKDRLHLICADCDQAMTGGTPAEGGETS